ncbi:MAG: hypothetical protein GY811_27605 [Myxococcales bacterium]|nr:hypothetical protein [Myxococcales bacterium]
MTCTRIAAAFLLIAACSGGDDGGDGADMDAASSGGDSLSLSGTACQSPIDFTIDAPIAVSMDGTDLNAIVIADGPFFDVESDAAWATYAASNDVFFVLSFSDPEPATPHTITSIFDSFFAGRGAGIVAFTERDPTASVNITQIDMEAKTISVSLSIPVAGYSDEYPPNFANFNECEQGLLTGSFSGTFSQI